MSDNERERAIRAEIMDRARAVEDNQTVPGQPTLAGLMVVLVEEITTLRARVEDLERRIRRRPPTAR
jgi:hypothetical protein